MKPVSLFAALALIPAAFNPNPARAGIVVPLCIDGKQGQSVTIPMPASPFQREDAGCCAKGCHAGSSRKRGSCHN